LIKITFLSLFLLCFSVVFCSDPADIIDFEVPDCSFPEFPMEVYKRALNGEVDGYLDILEIGLDKVSVERDPCVAATRLFNDLCFDEDNFDGNWVDDFSARKLYHTSNKWLESHKSEYLSNSWRICFYFLCKIKTHLSMPSLCLTWKNTK
jgi:hypothetical protein